MKFLRYTRKLLKHYDVVIKECDDVDHSYTAGREIYLGKYKNIEFRLISLFHELGHIIRPKNLAKKYNYNTLLIEIECWRIGLLEARKLGINFSDEAIEWGYKQALSYVGHDKRENCRWNEKYAPFLWINSDRGPLVNKNERRHT